MNLIVSARLDGAQKQVIHELTLKKQRSKKCTMSERQLAARNKLAQELLQERKPGAQSPTGFSSEPRLDSITPVDTPSRVEAPAAAAELGLLSSASVCSSAESPTVGKATATATGGKRSQQEQQGSLGSTGSSRCSFSRSDSSYSGSSQESNPSQLQLQSLLTLDEQDSAQTSPSKESPEPNSSELEAHLSRRKKEASIKFNQIRLEHLNGELERRLHQYEYLVAQEKALLGSYNMELFTNQGVNNFHLFEANQPRRQTRGAQRNSSSASLVSSSTASSAQSSGATPSQPLKGLARRTNKAGCLQAAINKQLRPTLNSSASTVSNLNTLHMLPLLAAPRRSASSVALLTMSQSRIAE